MNFSLPSPPGQQPETPGPARDLPPRERPVRRRRGGPKAFLIAVAGIAIAAGVALTSIPSLGTSLGLGRFFGNRGSDILYARVGRGKLPVTVVERGNLESSSNLDVVNEVEGMTQIIKILPEGTPVHKGSEVKLLAGIAAPSEIPASGKDIAYIARDQAQALHFRVFDGDGKPVVDADEKGLTDKAEALNDLKQQLELLWATAPEPARDAADRPDAADDSGAPRQPPRELYGSEKDRLVNGLITLFGPVLKKWELVCELDSANLRDQLVNQEIATKRAEADLEQARKTLEVAEIAVKEYVEGTFPQDEQSAEGQIKLAEADLIRAQDRLEWSDRMLAIGYVTQTQNQADKLALQKAQFTLRENQTKLEVLRKYTREKQIKELKANVEKARSDQLAKQATHNLELSKELKLRKQIEKCKMFAPGDGLIVYANEQNRFGSNQPLIEEGATVRERQRIFSLPDISQMRVNTKVHESMVDRVRPRLKARIRVDAFPQQVLTGTVDAIQPLPDPSSFFSSDVKVYTTLVSIDNEHSGLRPGMTAQVEILVDQKDDVLSVPVQAVLEFKNKDYVYVATPNGPAKREIKLGISNDKLIEIKEGLAEGEQVALSPASLMTDQEKREAFSTASKGKTGEWSADAVKAGVAPGALPAGIAKGAADAPKGGAEKGAARKGAAPSLEMLQKLQSLAPEDRDQLKSASPEDRQAILRKAGFSDAEIQQLGQMRRGGGRRGGPGGPGAPEGGSPQ